MLRAAAQQARLGLWALVLALVHLREQAQLLAVAEGEPCLRAPAAAVLFGLPLFPLTSAHPAGEVHVLFGQPCPSLVG